MNPQHHPRTREFVGRPVRFHATPENAAEVGVNLVLIGENGHPGLRSVHQVTC